MIEKIISTVKYGIDVTRESEIDHLRVGRVERNFTFHLANNISVALNIPSIRVDPFYDKHDRATKYLNNRRIELDIAVHERYTDEYNLIAIELETTNSPKRDDVWKVKGLTAPLGGYGYQLGLYVVFGVGAQAGEILTEEWYQDGRRCDP